MLGWGGANKEAKVKDQEKTEMPDRKGHREVGDRGSYRPGERQNSQLSAPL